MHCWKTWLACLIDIKKIWHWILNPWLAWWCLARFGDTSYIRFTGNVLATDNPPGKPLWNRTKPLVKCVCESYCDIFESSKTEDNSFDASFCSKCTWKSCWSVNVFVWDFTSIADDANNAWTWPTDVLSTMLPTEICIKQKALENICACAFTACIGLSCWIQMENRWFDIPRWKDPSKWTRSESRDHPICNVFPRMNNTQSLTTGHHQKVIRPRYCPPGAEPCRNPSLTKSLILGLSHRLIWTEISGDIAFPGKLIKSPREEQPNSFS